MTVGVPPAASKPAEDSVGGGQRALTYLLTLLSAVSYLLFGYDTGVVSGALLLVREDFQLSDLWHSSIVSVAVGAAGLAALAAGPLADRAGRKPVILGAALLTTVPIYISEAAPAAARGTLVTAMTCVGTLGTVVAGVTSGALSGVHEGWRWMFGLSAVPATLQLIGFGLMPESPRSLVARGHDEAARDVLRRIRGPGAHVDTELAAIQSDFAAQEALRQTAEAAGDGGGCGGTVLSRAVRDPIVRRALVTGCCLQLFQQLSGVNTVIYYSASIITMAGVRDPSTAIWLSSVVNVLSLLSKLAGLAVVERAGRRRILLSSTAGSAAALVLLGVGFQLSAARSAPDLPGGPANGSCVPLTAANSSAALGRCAEPAALGLDGLTWAPDWCPTDYAWLPITGMFLYITMFSPGLGAMPWTITAEIFPLWARSRCNAVTTAVNWCSNLVVSQTFLVLIAAVTRQGAFFLFSGLTVMGWAVFYVTVPETKGVPLERIGTLFTEPVGLHAPRPSNKVGPEPDPTGPRPAACPQLEPPAGTPVLPRAESVGWPAVYAFCVDRLRAVRQDLTVQQAAGPQALAVLRRCAVFHLYADYRSRDCPLAVFDRHINTRQLQECLLGVLRLQQAQPDVPTELCERFEAVHLLTSLPHERRMHERWLRPTNRDLRLALDFRNAWELGNFVRACRLSGEMSPLLQLAVYRHLAALRQ
ncbi:proton myo-inositol cotransporter-like [Amphibalanus amphitrite]|uniref:proton myo-inositol cotransporter-like n=1 Tax=Amphibalanus amphitrite TaxID=1232801 RepID=UPI001C911EAA|nr:proton myo-inositol cotransporter-like [Amphibalanus amphitrite]